MAIGFLISTAPFLIAEGEDMSSSSDTATSTDQIYNEQDTNPENPVLGLTETGDPPLEIQPLLDSNSSSSSPENSAEENNANNTNTGDCSDNNAVNNTNTETNVNTDNNAVTVNDSYLRSDTGKNNANYNTGSGIVTTEKATGNGEIINTINTNNINVDQAQSSGSATNSGTGDNSNNTAETNINGQLTVRSSNDSNTINRLEAIVNSGQNSTSYNTGHGIALTGKANLGVNFVTMANTNIVNGGHFYANWQNVYNDYTGDLNLAQESVSDNSALSDVLLQASNLCTGENSTNQAIVNVNNETTIMNTNNGKIQNDITAKAVTGQNKSNHNTGTGSVTTGEVDSSVNVLNFLNSNITYSNSWLKSFNVFGNWKGNLLLPSMPVPNLQSIANNGIVSEDNGTGCNSTSTSEVNATSTLNIENINDAVITTNVNMKTNTGDNVSSYNGGSGIIKFGKSDAETNEVNVANLNITGDSWWLVLINKFGSWTGTTVGSPDNMSVNGSGISTVLSPQNSGIQVSNRSTGPASNNIAGVNITNTTDITNINSADIQNNLNIEAISGENETQFNTGHGYVEAGDVKGTNNLINFANANINVGNWLVSVINIFGDWEGNLVFNNSSSNSNSDSSGTDGSNSGNTNTGTNSDNNSSTNTNNNTNASSTNNSNVNNNADATSLTGENNANYNTGSGIVSTGGATTDSSINNNINQNTTNIGTGGTGSSTGSNSNTGYNSNNNASSSNSNENNIYNNNNVIANNDLNAYNSTGQNSSNYNTGDGVIDTGWAETYVDLYNQYNENQTSIGEVTEDINEGSHEEPADNDDSGNSNGNNSGSGGSGGGGGGGSGGGTFNNTLSAAGSKTSSSTVTIKGDLNGDKRVNDRDFSILSFNWGKPFAKADLNNDGKINEFDLSILLSFWTK